MECSTRQVGILRQLIRCEPQTSAAISHALHVSERTVRSEIKEINRRFGAIILPLKGKGYALADRAQAEALIAESAGRNASRQTLIFKHILNAGESDYYDLAERYYISESTLDSDIQELNEGILKRYQVRIVRRSNTLFLNCGEELRRRIFTYFLMNEVSWQTFDLSGYEGFFQYTDIGELRDTILSFLRARGTAFNDTEITALLLHIAILIDRVKSGHALKQAIHIGEDKDPQLAGALCACLEKQYRLTLPDTERTYLSSLLSCRIGAPLDEEAATVDMMAFVNAALTEADAGYQTQLAGDLVLKNNLVVHLLALKERVLQNRRLSNPMIYEIKEKFPFLYDISVFISMKIHARFGFEMNEDEIGFITLHLLCSMEKARKERYRIAVFDPVGRRDALYYRDRLGIYFPQGIMEVECFSIFEPERLTAFDPSFILSTAPLARTFRVPVILCSPLLTERDIHSIRRCMAEIKIRQSKNRIVLSQFDRNLFFPELEIGDKKALLHFLCEKLQENGYCDKRYEALVLEREHVAPTSFGNLFAIPHPIKKEALRSGIAIATLKRAMDWSGQKVRLVFLFSLTRENDNLMQLYEGIVGMLDDVNKVKRLLQETSYEGFVEEFIR